MIRRAVYDTMIFFQWASLPADRQHATTRAIYDGSLRLCLSDELFDEIREVLSRPEIRSKAPNLTDARLKGVLAAALDHADWFGDVAKAFTWPLHRDDDHLFNLAIAANANYLVTWESRIHKLATDSSDDALRLEVLAPQLQIVSPKDLAEQLRSRQQ